MTRQAVRAEPARLSLSKLWERQHGFFVREGAGLWTRNVVPRYITTNPFIAHAYAEVLLAYFEDCFDAARAEGLSPDAGEDSPVHIIELGAGSGQFSFHFLKHFAPLYEELSGGRRGFRYVMTDISDSTIELWRSHEHLCPFVEAGVLDFARFDACRDEDVRLLVSGHSLAREVCKAPAAFIANYVFDCLPQDVFELRGGELYECFLEPDEVPVLEGAEDGEPTQNQHVELNYDARPCSFDFYERRDWNETLRGYRESFTDGAFLFPVGALRCIEKLSDISGGRFMLIAGDKGLHRAEAFAGQRKPALVRHGGCFSLDVNFHAIAEQARRAGARVLHREQDPSHLNVVAFAYGGAHNSLRRTVRAYMRHVAEFGPDDFYNVMSDAMRNARALSLETIVSLLRLSRFDPLLLINCCQRLVQTLPSAPASARRAFYETMRATEECCFPLEPEQNPDFYFGALAGSMEMHEEAVAYYRRATSVYNSAGAEHNLGLSYLMTGEAEAARRCFERAGLMDEELIQARLMSEKLDAWLRADSASAVCEETGTRLFELAEGQAIFERLRHPEITLEPLLPQHAEAFYEHATPEILGLTRLPPFSNVEEVRGWIRTLTADARNYSFAITHRTHGFVGVVSMLKVSDRAARFFSWLGGAFTGRGYATAAVCRLTKFALDCLALDELFTCVLPHNERSIRVLRCLGFRRAEVPGDELHYYRQGVVRFEGVEETEHMRRLLAEGPRVVIKHVTL